MVTLELKAGANALLIQCNWRGSYFWPAKLFLKTENEIVSLGERYFGRIRNGLISALRIHVTAENDVRLKPFKNSKAVSDSRDEEFVEFLYLHSGEEIVTALVKKECPCGNSSELSGLDLFFLRDDRLPWLHIRLSEQEVQEWLLSLMQTKDIEMLEYKHIKEKDAQLNRQIFRKRIKDVIGVVMEFKNESKEYSVATTIQIIRRSELLAWCDVILTTGNKVIKSGEDGFEAMREKLALELRPTDIAYGEGRFRQFNKESPASNDEEVWFFGIKNLLNSHATMVGVPVKENLDEEDLGASSGMDLFFFLNNLSPWYSMYRLSEGSIRKSYTLMRLSTSLWHGAVDHSNWSDWVPQTGGWLGMKLEAGSNALIIQQTVPAKERGTLDWCDVIQKTKDGSFRLGSECFEIFRKKLISSLRPPYNTSKKYVHFRDDATFLDDGEIIEGFWIMTLSVPYGSITGVPVKKSLGENTWVLTGELDLLFTGDNMPQPSWFMFRLSKSDICRWIEKLERTKKLGDSG
jgi:hypothetical protein